MMHVFIAIFLLCSSVAQGMRLSDYVNPFIGASTNTSHSYHGLGKTFPGAATPFGMTQVSPNTITGGDNGSGYSFEHTTIEGFAFTQMSGVGWYGDLGNFLVLPLVGEDAGCSHYDKSSEMAQAGYYSVFLTGNNIAAEATAAPHSGILRFTFPESEQSRIRINLSRRVGGTSDYQHLQIVNDSTIRGYMVCTPQGGGWGHGAGNPDYTVYFYAQFSKPFATFEIIGRDSTLHESEGRDSIFYAGFPTHKDEVITLKAGISFVDLEGAEKNFVAEMAGRSFDDVRTAARELWDEALGKIIVEGGSEEQKVIFYTALYHTMIDPRMFSDVDGRYWGGDRQAHGSDKFCKRTIFSGWDVFRSQFPLQTIINPGLVNDMINSFITLAEENGKGYYDRWEFLNAYSGCMIGNPFLSVLADAYQKGVRGYDAEKAYQYAVNTARKFGNGDLGYTPSPDYSISSTLEYAYTDWCMSVLAKALNKDDDALYFARRAQAYRNVFDKEKGWFRPKTSDGVWEEWPEDARIQEWYGCIESNPYQQGWFVPHDIPGMTLLMGGEKNVLADLTLFFEKTPGDLMWNQFYNHANEPVHHVPYLFNRLHAPRLTQKWTRHICERAYHNSVEGLVGNEDVGQMSAWYVMSAAGIHPLCPGDGRYEITSPVFESIVFRLNNGKTFTIEAKNNSPENIYIQKIQLNGKAYKQFYLNHTDILKGGKLELMMGK
jgi:predicted alpha-1,2-mannosidase